MAEILICSSTGVRVRDTTCGLHCLRSAETVEPVPRTVPRWKISHLSCPPDTLFLQYPYAVPSSLSTHSLFPRLPFLPFFPLLPLLLKLTFLPILPFFPFASILQYSVKKIRLFARFPFLTKVSVVTVL